MSPSSAETASPKCLLVLGVHRSGTSMLSGSISRLGLQAAATLMPPTSANERGYYESLPISKLNDRIFSALGTSWKGWEPIDPSWFATPQALEFQIEALELVQSEFDISAPFVLKDPRICRLFPFWKAVLDQLDVPPTIFHIHRNPLEVAASLSEREAFGEDYALLLWLRYVLDVEFSSRNTRRVFTSYALLLKDWKSELASISEMSGLETLSKTDQSESGVMDFISPDLRHARRTSGELKSKTEMRWIVNVFQILERWVRLGESEDDYPRLDRIRKTFDSVAPMFGGAVRQGVSSALQLSKTRDKLQKAYRANKKLRGRNGDLVDLVAKLEAELEGMRKAKK